VFRSQKIWLDAAGFIAEFVFAVSADAAPTTIETSIPDKMQIFIALP
jgi:hypothetical protein